MLHQELIVRCFAQCLQNEQWQAFSIEYGLAAQGGSLEEVRHKLDAMICTYLEDALIGEDREYARQLLSRKAPLSIQARYHWYSLLSHIKGAIPD